MNNLIVVVLYGLISVGAYANSPSGNGYGHSHDSDSHGDSSAIVSIGSSDKDINVGSTASNELSTVDSTVIRQESSQVANAVASLSLPFCGAGSGGSTKQGSFNIGGASYSCEVSRLVAVMDEHSSNLLLRAEKYPVGSFERNQALDRSAELQTKIFKILGDDAVQYLTNRGNTASWSTWVKDFWPVILGLVLIL